MKRIGGGGRFARETEEEKAARLSLAEDERGVASAPAAKPKPMTASSLRQSRKLLTHKVAEALPEIVDVLVKQAKDGSLGHTQAFLKLAEQERSNTPVQAPKYRHSALAKRLLDELRRPPDMEHDG